MTLVERAVLLVGHKYLDVEAAELADMLVERGLTHYVVDRWLVMKQGNAAKAASFFP